MSLCFSPYSPHQSLIQASQASRIQYNAVTRPTHAYDLWNLIVRAPKKLLVFESKGGGDRECALMRIFEGSLSTSWIKARKLQWARNVAKEPQWRVFAVNPLKDDSFDERIGCQWMRVVWLACYLPGQSLVVYHATMRLQSFASCIKSRARAYVC